MSHQLDHVEYAMDELNALAQHECDVFRGNQKSQKGTENSLESVDQAKEDADEYNAICS